MGQSCRTAVWPCITRAPAPAAETVSLACTCCTTARSQPCTAARSQPCSLYRTPRSRQLLLPVPTRGKATQGSSCPRCPALLGHRHPPSTCHGAGSARPHHQQLRSPRQCPGTHCCTCTHTCTHAQADTLHPMPQRPPAPTPAAPYSAPLAPAGPVPVPELVLAAGVAHHPDPGSAAHLAVGLKHPAVVGEEQLQRLPEEQDGREPDAGGEEHGAHHCPALVGQEAAVGADRVRGGCDRLGGHEGCAPPQDVPMQGHVRGAGGHVVGPPGGGVQVGLCQWDRDVWGGTPQGIAAGPHGHAGGLGDMQGGCPWETWQVGPCPWLGKWEVVSLGDAAGGAVPMGGGSGPPGQAPTLTSWAGSGGCGRSSPGRGRPGSRRSRRWPP